MLKRLLAAVAFTLAIATPGSSLEKALPGAQLRFGVMGAGGTTTRAMNLALNRDAVMFRLSEAKTISSVKFYVSNVSGSLGAGDITVDIYSNSVTTLQPDSSLGSSTTITTYPTAPAWVEATGFSVAVSANVNYWAVIRNTDAVPATTNFTLSYLDGIPLENSIGTGFGGLIVRKSSTDGGTTWGSFLTTTGSFRIGFDDGSYWGVPLESSVTSPVGNGVYSTREHGLKFTVPANVRVKIAGAGTGYANTGTPTGFPRYRLYNNTTLMATTGDNGIADQAALLQILYFPTPQELVGGNTYRIVMGETTQSDASSARYNISGLATIENDANSKALIPWGAHQTYYDGSSWTDTTTAFTPWILPLATDAETPAGGSMVFVPVE